MKNLGVGPGYDGNAYSPSATAILRRRSVAAELPLFFRLLALLERLVRRRLADPFTWKKLNNKPILIFNFEGMQHVQCP